MFGGDSRFVINGSSLQIRSPRKRYDEAVYVCRPLGLATLGPEAPGSPGQESVSAAAAAGYPQQRASDLRHQLLGPASVHQSSLAPPSASDTIPQQSCDSLLDSTLFRDGHQAGGSPLSSISIRIVGK